MTSIRDIRGFSMRLAEEYKPRRIILFGSYAYGRPGPDSDVDLLIILPGKGTDLRRAVEMRLKLHPDFPLDLLVRSPMAVRKRVAMGDCFMKEILEKGKVLYEAHRA
ncbi:MAG: nucleotidyltransferase domain-containing protein [Elusimicrobiota bacterium]|nr:nucleotidyltransferase domain-containing protein [Elusimicrobiota bacterium]